MCGEKTPTPVPHLSLPKRALPNILGIAQLQGFHERKTSPRGDAVGPGKVRFLSLVDLLFFSRSSFALSGSFAPLQPIFLPFSFFTFSLPPSLHLFFPLFFAPLSPFPSPLTPDPFLAFSLSFPSFLFLAQTNSTSRATFCTETALPPPDSREPCKECT